VAYKPTEARDLGMAYKPTESRDLGMAYKPTEAGFQPRRKGLVVDYYFKAPQCEAHSGECHWLAFLKVLQTLAKLSLFIE